MFGSHNNWVSCTSRQKSNRVIESNRWQSNSNRFENLKYNSNRLQCNINSNRQDVIDPIPGVNREYLVL